VTRLLVFGNSGAGKSTLAAYLAEAHGLAHLDLDTLAWEPGVPPTRRPVSESAADIEAFTGSHDRWVIEGCYGDLLAIAAPLGSRLIFLNPGVEACVDNCRRRPWEPHKYSSPAAQDRNLDMLVQWVRDYETRTDVFSLGAHRELYDGFDGDKMEFGSNVCLEDVAKTLARVTHPTGTSGPVSSAPGMPRTGSPGPGIPRTGISRRGNP